MIEDADPALTNAEVIGSTIAPKLNEKMAEPLGPNSLIPRPALKGASWPACAGRMSATRARKSPSLKAGVVFPRLTEMLPALAGTYTARVTKNERMNFCMRPIPKRKTVLRGCGLGIRISNERAALRAMGHRALVFHNPQQRLNRVERAFAVRAELTMHLPDATFTEVPKHFEDAEFTFAGRYVGQ